MSISSRLNNPVAPYSLAIFRIGFGLLMVVEVMRYFSAGWISDYYLEPEFLFTYFGFDWVSPWPGQGLYWHFGLVILLSLMITIGWHYRLAIWLFIPGFAYIFLLDQARYLNHFYLVGIIAVVLALTPAHHAWSMDARRAGQRRMVPAWSVWGLMLLFEIVLLYAGIVKINPDWLAGRPLDSWFAERGKAPLIGPLIAGDWAIYAASYGSILLHLLGAPLLFFRRTRLWVFLVYCAFHLTNAVVFSIGIFPWMTMAGTLMFFSPDWPMQLLRKLGFKSAEVALAAPLETRAWVVPALGAFLLFQALFPLRHYLYPGDVAWTEEGHRFAWRMKLRGKSGHVAYYLKDPQTGQKWQVNPQDYLSRRQYRYLSGRPDMILQFAHYLEQKWQQEKSLGDIEVRASAWCSLNGHPHRLLIDPAVDLTTRSRELWPAADWILPRPSF